LRLFYLVVGAISAVFCAVVGVTSTVVAYWNIDGSFARPKVSALIFGIFWSVFVVVSLWVVLAYFRERLFVARNAVVQRGVLRSKTIDIADVIRVKWRNWPVGGSVVAQSHSGKITVYLDNFPTRERGPIIQFFRETFATEIQDNWARFEGRTRQV
jgi:hypothetical protein